MPWSLTILKVKKDTNKTKVPSIEDYNNKLLSKASELQGLDGLGSPWPAQLLSTGLYKGLL